MLASQTEVPTRTLPNFPGFHPTASVCAPPPRTPQSLGVHEHVSSLPLPSSSAGSSRALEFLFFTPRPAAMGSNLFLFFSLSLFPGIDSDVECLGTSTRIYCLHCFLCMTLYAVSMFKKKKKKRRKTFSKTNLHVLDKKKKKKRLYSQCPTRNYVAASLCFLASVWPCSASMRYCPLWRILGEEEPHPRGSGGGSGSPEPLGSPGC